MSILFGKNPIRKSRGPRDLIFLSEKREEGGRELFVGFLITKRDLISIDMIKWFNGFSSISGGFKDHPHLSAGER